MSNFVKSLRFLIPLLLVGAIGFFLWRGLSINPRLVPSVLINHRTPGFDLPSLEKPHQYLSNKIFKGQVSLLNVWATWCVVCAEEHPVLMDISRNYKVTIYGLDYKDKRQSALNWIKRYGDPYGQIGFDATGKVAINWGVYGTPETFIIDKQGIIRYKQIGPITQQMWQQKLWPMVQKLQQE